jgi:hypothetical protein
MPKQWLTGLWPERKNAPRHRISVTTRNALAGVGTYVVAASVGLLGNQILYQFAVVVCSMKHCVVWSNGAMRIDIDQAVVEHGFDLFD